MAAATICIAALAAIPAAQPAVSIELPERAAVSSGPLKLGDIAKITGDPELAARFRQVSLGLAPLPGHSRLITVGWLRFRIRACGLRPELASFTGAEAVRVYVQARQSTAARANAKSAKPGPNASAPPQPAIRRGQTISIVARRGLVVVRAIGRALEDGFIGEFIQVEIKHTHRRILARVVGPRCVEVAP